jgi:hypothetical protein
MTICSEVNLTYLDKPRRPVGARRFGRFLVIGGKLAFNLGDHDLSSTDI